jgi:uncharacterized paraquat-inducible protein A
MKDTVINMHCNTCDTVVDTPEKIASGPDGYCPSCGNLWSGAESRDTIIAVFSPGALGATTML